MKVSIAVIGAGVSGLSTACNVQQQLPEAEVTIIAEQFSPNTTSDVAAGFWEPHLLRDTPLELQRRWSKCTLDHLKRLYYRPEGQYVGVHPISGYRLFPGKEQEIQAEADLDGVRRLTTRELQMWPGYTSGVFYTTYMCESYIYLPWLLQKFKQNGGKVVQRKLHKLTELFGAYAIIVNCAGLGSRKLVGDSSLEPIKGHTFRVKAPWLKHFHVFDSGQVVTFPGANNIIVGGTADVGNWDLEPDPEDSRMIWSRACAHIPSLQGAIIEKEVCGLRPSRPKVRLEMEMMQQDDKIIPVIHNYGHGGAGITLHWGCATDVAAMVKQAAQTIRMQKSRL